MKDEDDNLYKRALLWAYTKQGPEFTWTDMQSELELNDKQLKWIQKVLYFNMPISDNLIVHSSYTNDTDEHRFTITAKGIQAADTLRAGNREWFEKWWGIVI